MGGLKADEAVAVEARIAVSRLVGVHGIAQQQVGRHQLQAPWARALADGMERSVGRRVAVPAFDIAFYGDLFVSAPAGGAKGPDRDDDAEWDDVTDAEISDLVAAAGSRCRAAECCTRSFSPLLARRQHRVDPAVLACQLDGLLSAERLERSTVMLSHDIRRGNSWNITRGERLWAS